MFDRWGLLVSVTQCCPSMDSACISASNFPAFLSEHPHVTEATLAANLGSWSEWPWKPISSQHVGLEIFKGGIWSEPGVLSPTFSQVPSYSGSWWQASPYHLPPFGFPGWCQCLAEGPCLQGRHTAVIKSLVEEWSSPNGTALWLWAFAWRHLSCLAPILLKCHKCKLFLFVCNWITSKEKKKHVLPRV